MECKATLFGRLIEAAKRENGEGFEHLYGLLRSKATTDTDFLLLEKISERASKVDPVPHRGKICGAYHRLPQAALGRAFEGGTRINGGVARQLSGDPLVTIITVVYNNERTIEKCIQSVLAQTYSSIEYIVIDGASTDGTLDVIRRYLDRIDYVISEPDSGIYNAMNKGLSLASGEYIAFLNADDFYLSDAVLCSISNILENDLQLSYASFTYADEDGVAVVADEARDWDESLLVQGVPGGHETLFLHRDCYDLLNGYDETYRLAADYHLFVRCFLNRFRARPLNRNILVMSLGGASFNEQLERDENHRILKYCFGELESDFAEFLYSQKYYKHWHGYNEDIAKIQLYLARAGQHGPLLTKGLSLTLMQRKNGITGKLLPNPKRHGDKLKICVVLNFLSNASGGAERIAVESANRLYEEGHAVTVVQCFGLAGEPYYRVRPEIPVIDLAVFPYKQQYLMPPEQLPISFERYGGREFEQLDFCPTEKDFEDWKDSPHFWRCRVYAGFFHHHNFDVVISHMPSSYPYVLLSRAETDSTLHIASLHNAPEFKFYSPLYPADSPMERYMRLVALENADRIGVLFEEFTSQMPEAYREKCFTLPNFLSDDIDQQARSYDNPEAWTNQVFLSVGRLSEQKDHETLIRAFASVKKRLPGWKLYIFGEGPLREHLAHCCSESGLDPSDVLKGATKDISSAYRQGSVFVFPSVFEGFGLTALEAMAFGLPVIAFQECEGVRNLISDGENGVLVKAGNRTSSLASALIDVATNTRRIAEMGRNARFYARHFAVKRYIDSIELEAERHLRSQRSVVPVEVCRSVKLKYAILTTYTEGGAGIAAARLAKGLRREGVQVSIVTFSEGDSRFDFNVKLDQENQALYDISMAFSRENVKPGGTFFAEPRFPGLTANQLAFLATFDVINLHWVQMLLSVESVERILAMGKKVIWTLHDMAPFTGGCHYSDGCLGYTSQCRGCSQLTSQLADHPSAVLAEKLKRWDTTNLTVVAPSKWLADCAAQSQLFRNCSICHIPNGLDVEMFVPTGKTHARNFFGLPQDKKVLLFTCQSHGERRKGFQELVKVADFLGRQRDDLHILTFGHESKELKELPIPSTSVGHVGEEWKLAVGYSAADVTLLPSLEDNLPNVILESFSANTPVVVFDTGGCGELIIDGANGFAVAPFDCEMMAKRVGDVLGWEPSSAPRAFAEKFLNLRCVASRYLELVA